MKSVLALASLATMVSGAAISKRQSSFTFECSGSKVPDYGACDGLVQPICDNPTGTNGPVYAPANSIVYSTGEDQNCQIIVLIKDDGFVVTNEQVCQGYSAAKMQCSVGSAGGAAVSTDGKYEIQVYNNPDYRAPSRMIKRGSAPVKRQQEGDTSFSVGIHTTDAKPSQYRSNVGDGYPGGTQITISESETVSNTVGFSASVSSDFFGIISASVGFDVSQTEEHTSSMGETITINCDTNQVGQLYFQPYYETWFGAFSPSGSQLTVYRPETNSDGTTKGEYNYDCHE